MKHQKQILIYICALVFLFGTLNAMALIIDEQKFGYYRIYINGENIGLVETKEDGEIAIDIALDSLITELGYDPEVTPKIEFEQEYSKTEDIIPNDILMHKIQKVIKEDINVIKVKAFAMKIGDDLVVTLESKEAIEEVLQDVQDTYVEKEQNYRIMLSNNPYNSLVKTPNSILMQEQLDENRTFSTSIMSVGEDETGIIVGQDQLAVGTALEDGLNNNKILSIEFDKDIMVAETYSEASKILNVEEATNLITKETEKPLTYIVKSGDSLSKIAADNNMSLESLINMNLNIVNQELLQIGDKLNIMVPKPELSVKTTEEVVYTELVRRATDYVENAEKYVNTESILSEGSDGEKQIVAVVKKINGVETEKTIINDLVLIEPKNKIVEEGTKPLPTKSSLGNFSKPLVNYVLTSGYGYRWDGFHSALDLAAPTGTNIRAAYGGEVTFAGWSGNYGNLIIIDHGDGVTTRYAHCSFINVSVGDRVSQDDKIGEVGSTGNSTGPHLHYEVRIDGEAKNPYNYMN